VGNGFQISTRVKYSLFTSPNVAPPFGPVLGGVIAEKLGWNSIFWFLSILGGLCLIIIVLVLPETSRKIVGNGTIPASGLSKSPLVVFSKRQKVTAPAEPGNLSKKARFRFPNPLDCLMLILKKDVFIVLLCNGIYYATYCCVQASLSSLFVEVYGYEALEAGLIYMPFGFGCLLSTYSWGEY
jgi:MFS family permease